MENLCKKTGADVWVTDSNCYFHGDLFKLNDVWYFRYVGNERDDKKALECDYVFDTDNIPYSAFLNVQNTMLISGLYVHKVTP